MATFDFGSMARRTLDPNGTGDEFATLDWTDSEGKQQVCDIVIGLRGPRGLSATSAAAPPRGQMARLREASTFYYVIVQSSNRREDRYMLDLIYSYAGRRQDQREEVSGRADVSWLPPGRFATSRCDARVFDISPDGLGIRTDTQLPVGIEVRVAGSSLECVGRTVYCRKTGAGFQTGVKLRRAPDARL